MFRVSELRRSRRKQRLQPEGPRLFVPLLVVDSTDLFTLQFDLPQKVLKQFKKTTDVVFVKPHTSWEKVIDLIDRSAGNIC